MKIRQVGIVVVAYVGVAVVLVLPGPAISQLGWVLLTLFFGFLFAFNYSRYLRTRDSIWLTNSWIVGGTGLVALAGTLVAAGVPLWIALLVDVTGFAVVVSVPLVMTRSLWGRQRAP